MRSKLFEVRDRATFIPVMATRLNPKADATSLTNERYLLQRAGFSGNEPDPFVLLVKLTSFECHAAPHHWKPGTIADAHEFIADHWDELTTGDVIDCEFIRGESDYPKGSECDE